MLERFGLTKQEITVYNQLSISKGKIGQLYILYLKVWLRRVLSYMKMGRQENISE